MHPESERLKVSTGNELDMDRNGRGLFTHHPNVLAVGWDKVRARYSWRERTD